MRQAREFTYIVWKLKNHPAFNWILKKRAWMKKKNWVHWFGNLKQFEKDSRFRKWLGMEESTISGLEREVQNARFSRREVLAGIGAVIGAVATSSIPYSSAQAQNTQETARVAGKLPIQEYYQRSTPVDMMPGARVFNWEPNYAIRESSLGFNGEDWVSYYFSEKYGSSIRQILSSQSNGFDINAFNNFMGDHRETSQPKGVFFYRQGYLVLTMDQEKYSLILPIDTEVVDKIQAL